MDTIEPTLAIPMSTPIPGVLGLRVKVAKTVLQQRMMPTPNVTLYRNSELPTRERVDEFGDYVFTADEDEGMYHAFSFVPDRSTTRTTKVEALSYPLADDHPWKPCLIELGALEDATQPLSFEASGNVVEVPRLFGRMHLLPGAMYATEIDVETFVSDRPFTREEMGRLEEQVTAQINWQGRNLTVNLDCLHGGLEFPETQTNATPFYGLGTKNAPRMLKAKVVYPPTSMTKWRRYLFKQEHRPVGGMWMLTNFYANPPRGARKLLNLAV